MRLTAATAVMAGMLAAGPAAAAAVPFEAEVNRLELLSQSCDAGVCDIVFEGSGGSNLMGSLSFRAELEQDFTVPLCSPVSGVLTFTGRTGSITLADRGTVCGNGAGPSLFPSTISTRWQITSADGEFTGITGSGSSRGVIGGNGPVVHFSGSVVR